MDSNPGESQRIPDRPLVYAGTRNLVRPGDRIHIKWGFRKSKEGTFCYVPGISRWDRRLRYWWVIKADDGAIVPSAHFPDPVTWKMPHDCEFTEMSKRITFLRRRVADDPDPESLLPQPPHSLMYYRDGTEILVGDRIRFRSIFRGWRALEGTVTHIPGLAPEDPDLYEGNWAFETDDGWAFSCGSYAPGRIINRLTFIRRAEDKLKAE
ncbi:MAG TPA: hypothetical protein VMG59_09605 [Phycisphaerae bacterium]|nr:hypothetical protein [Phycisphaerae bacterium]